MSTAQLLPNMMMGNTGAVAKGMQAMGMPPVGNAGGSNIPGPTSIQDIATSGGTFSAPANPIDQAPVIGAVPGVNNLQNTGQVPNAISNDPALLKQLNDTFGKGVGGAINSTIENLGSNDSTYMQAYNAAMAPQNAEGLATLDTTLSNSGVSANSSTAAIANADYQTGIVGQEGLQEQQLQQLDEQNLIGLLQGTQGAANKEASTSVWGDIGSVLGGIGSDVGSALGGTDLTKLF